MKLSPLKTILNTQTSIRRDSISLFYAAIFLESSGVIILALVMAYFLDAVLTGDSANPQFLLLLLMSFITNTSAELIQKKISLRQGAACEKDLRKRLIERAREIGKSLDSERFNSVFARSADLIGEYYRTYLPAIRKAITVPAIILVVVLYTDPISGALLAVVTIVTGVFLALTGDLARTEKEKRWDELSVLRKHFIEIVAGGETMRQMGAVERIRESLRNSAVLFRRLTSRMFRFVFISSFVLELMSTISVAMVAVVLGIRLIDGNVSYFQALVILVLVPEFFSYIKRLGSSRHSLMDAEAAAPAVTGFLGNIAIPETSAADVKIPERKESQPEKKLWVFIVLTAVLILAAHFSQMGLLMAGATLLAKSALKQPISSLHAIVALVRLLGISRPVFKYASRLASHYLALRLFEKIRLTVFDKLSELDFQQLRRLRSGEILNRLESDTETLDNVGPNIVWPVFSVVVVVLLMPFLPVFNDIAPRWLFIPLLWLSVLTPWFFWSWFPEEPEAGEVDQLSVDFARGVKDIAVMAGDNKDIALMNKSSLLTEARHRSTWRVSAVGVIAKIPVFGLWGLVLMNLGDLGGVSLALVLFGLVSFTELFNSMPEIVRLSKRSLEAYHRILSIISIPTGIERKSEERNLEIDNFLTIRNLSWDWSDLGNALFNNLSLSLEKGKFYGWVGPVGSGKSTLLDIVTGFHEVPENSVFLNGYDVSRTRQDKLLEKVSYVSQRAYVFSGTIRDNMRLAKPDISEQEMLDALDTVGLPGSRYNVDMALGENGVVLSGGERQRLLIARAMVQRREILLLDEPFNNLDRPTQTRVLNWLRSQAGQKTIVMITHQQYGLEYMDQVINLFND